MDKMGGGYKLVLAKWVCVCYISSLKSCFLMTKNCRLVINTHKYKQHYCLK